MANVLQILDSVSEHRSQRSFNRWMVAYTTHNSLWVLWTAKIIPFYHNQICKPLDTSLVSLCGIIKSPQNIYRQLKYYALHQTCDLSCCFFFIENAKLTSAAEKGQLSMLVIIIRWLHSIVLYVQQFLVLQCHDLFIKLNCIYM